MLIVFKKEKLLTSQVYPFGDDDDDDDDNYTHTYLLILYTTMIVQN